MKHHLHSLFLKSCRQEERIVHTGVSKILFISKCAIFIYCSYLFIACPWAPLWHGDMLSTLMVSDGIKALSWGHSRCSEPRPLVTLHGRRAVISVPYCQSAPPPLPKILSICRTSRADGLQAMHFSSIHCGASTHPASGSKDSWVRVYTRLNNTWSLPDFLCFCVCITLFPVVLTQLPLSQPYQNVPTLSHVRPQPPPSAKSRLVERTDKVSCCWFVVLFSQRDVFFKHAHTHTHTISVHVLALTKTGNGSDRGSLEERSFLGRKIQRKATVSWHPPDERTTLKHASRDPISKNMNKELLYDCQRGNVPILSSLLQLC